MSYTVYLEVESVNSTHVFEHITDSPKVGRNYFNYSRIKALILLEKQLWTVTWCLKSFSKTIYSLAMIQHGKNWQQYTKHGRAKVKLGKMLRLEVQPDVPGNTGKPRQSPSKNATEINSSWQSLSLSTWAEISRKVG